MIQEFLEGVQSIVHNQVAEAPPYLPTSNYTQVCNLPSQQTRPDGIHPPHQYSNAVNVLPYEFSNAVGHQQPLFAPHPDA